MRFDEPIELNIVQICWDMDALDSILPLPVWLPCGHSAERRRPPREGPLSHTFFPHAHLTRTPATTPSSHEEG